MKKATLKKQQLRIISLKHQFTLEIISSTSGQPAPPVRRAGLLANSCDVTFLSMCKEQAVLNVCARAQACEKDSQCGGGMCCAVSLWIRSLRMCTPMGQEGDDCHPMSHTVRVDACAPANEAFRHFNISFPTSGSFLWEAAAPHLSLPAKPVLHPDGRGEIQVSVHLQVPRLLPLRTIKHFTLVVIFVIGYRNTATLGCFSFLPFFFFFYRFAVLDCF